MLQGKEDLFEYTGTTLTAGDQVFAFVMQEDAETLSEDGTKIHKLEVRDPSDLSRSDFELCRLMHQMSEESRSQIIMVMSIV